MMKNSTLFVLSFSLLILSGCSDKVGLNGKVVFSDDGSQLTTGTVCFETDTYLSRGELKPDGTFVLGSLKESDGLPPGKYRVYISDAENVTVRNGIESYESMIDEKYTSARTSGIEIDVARSMKPVEIKVDRVVKK